MTDQPVTIDHAARVIALEQELAATRAQASARLIQSELKAEAVRAGMIDLDCLKLFELSSLELADDGTVPEAAAAMMRLKRDKPWMFAKPNSSHPAAAPAAEPPTVRMAKDMTHREWQIARERLVRGR